MKKPSVLIIDDEYRTDLYEMWLRESYSVRTATSRREIFEQLDETVLVVLLRHEFDTDLKSDVETRIEGVSPACRIAVTTSKHTQVAYPDVDCETSICEPITEATVTETVDRLLCRALYHDGLRRYYHLTMRVTNVELSDGEGEDRPEYDRLQDRIRALSDHLDEVKNRLDADDYRAVLTSLKPTQSFPSQSHGRKVKTDKHRPDRCRECGLAWGEDHGDPLGIGCQTLGAFTWKCTRCSTVQNVPSPSDRKVAR